MPHVMISASEKKKKRDLVFFFLIVNDQLLQCHSKVFRETAIIVSPPQPALFKKSS